MSSDHPIESSKSEVRQDTTPGPAPNGTRCNARGLPAGYLRSKLHTLAPRAEPRFSVFPAAAPPPGTRKNEIAGNWQCSDERKYPAGKPRAFVQLQ